MWQDGIVRCRREAFRRSERIFYTECRIKNQEERDDEAKRGGWPRAGEPRRRRGRGDEPRPGALGASGAGGAGRTSRGEAGAAAAVEGADLRRAHAEPDVRAGGVAALA